MLKSALGYFSGAAVSKEENDFVGQLVSLGVYKLRIVKVIAEGERVIHNVHEGYSFN